VQPQRQVLQRFAVSDLLRPRKIRYVEGYADCTAALDVVSQLRPVPQPVIAVGEAASVAFHGEALADRVLEGALLIDVQQVSTAAGNASNFVDRTLPSRDVLKKLRHDHGIEISIGERHVPHVFDHEFGMPASLHLGSGMSQHRLRHVNSDNPMTCADQRQ
jgi:hypothetical protein